MLYGSSEVVGLIEIDAKHSTASIRSLGPRDRSQRPASKPRRHACHGDTDIVTANLVQINADLRVELACLVKRIAKARARK